MPALIYLFFNHAFCQHNLFNILLIIGIGAIGYYIWKLKKKPTTAKTPQKSIFPKHTEVRRSLSRT